MKKLFLSLIISMPFIVLAQSITADPAVAPMKITKLNSTDIVITALPLNGIIKLKVPILNKNTINLIPPGTCKVKVNLGSKLVLDPDFNLTTVNTSNYFSWTVSSSGGQVQITGDLTAELPANFSDTAYFDVKGIILGNSTINTNFLVTNHNTNTTLSDENSANNTASTVYVITNILPVTFTNFFAEKNNCSLKIEVDTENEFNVDRYELEVSNSDNTNFEKVTFLNAWNLRKYIFNIEIPEKYKGNNLLLRIKSIDVDGKFQYSEIIKVSGKCDIKSELLISIFPNPIPQNANQFFIQNNKGLFNGNYSISIVDMSGKLIQGRKVELYNVAKYNFSTIDMAAGQYVVKMHNNKDNSLVYFTIIKL